MKHLNRKEIAYVGGGDRGYGPSSQGPASGTLICPRFDGHR